MHVVVGIITNTNNEILIAKRPMHTYKGGLWEFPGGKVELNEAPRAALERELAEELNIKVITATPWLEITHDYDDRVVFLDTWRITAYQGEAIGHEGQEIRWVDAKQLMDFEFPAGNRVLIQKLLA
jgi:8-oxo-dGTP diphosphatase